MSNAYVEGQAERHIQLVANGDGTWSATEGNSDPQTTIVRRFGKAEVAGTATVTTDTTLHTPASGNAVRLKWIAFNSGADGAESVVEILIGDTSAYLWSLTAPGAFMRSSIREGAADEALKIELTVDTTVYVNYELEEFTP